MRRAPALALAVVAFCLLTAVARGQGESQLEYRPFQTGLPGEFSSAQEFLPALPGAPAGLKLPELKGGAAYFSHTIGGRDTVLLIERGKQPKLYVDTDGDKDLAEETPIAAAAPKKSGGLLAALVGGDGGRQETVFGPVTVPGQEPGGDVEFRVRGLAGDDSFRYVFIEPAGLRSGVAELAGRKYSVRILDANLNGRYDDVLNPPNVSNVDWLGLGPEGRAGGQIQPLPRMLKVRDAWYSIQVRPDGSSVTLEGVEPAFGTLEAGPDVAALMLLSDTGIHQLRRSDDGKWELPEGRYSARQVVLNRKDDKGQTWQLSASGDTGKLADFAIQGGETLSAEAGSPLAVKTDVSVYAPGQAQISLVLQGKGGEEYTPGATKDGRRVAPPSYKIYNEAGEVLSSGRFQYG